VYSLIVIDDEAYIREHLRSAFDWETLGFSLDGCFADMEETLSYLRYNPADVMLTDIQLRSESGLNLAAIARELWPDISLVILSAHSDFEYAHTALRINVHDYLLKPVTFERVTECFADLKQTLDIRKGDGGRRQNNSSIEKSDYRIDIVKRHINKHLSDDLSLDSISSLVSMNPAYFSRFFKRRTGVYFADYLAERRMEKAIELLKDPRNRVFEISTMVGYFGKQNFYKRFREYTGRTPIEYRNTVLNMQADEDDS